MTPTDIKDLLQACIEARHKCERAANAEDFSMFADAVDDALYVIHDALAEFGKEIMKLKGEQDD